MTEPTTTTNGNRQSVYASRSHQNGASPKPLDDLLAYARDYARDQPEMAALWCLGIGFVLGWKMKPW